MPQPVGTPAPIEMPAPSSRAYVPGLPCMLVASATWGSTEVPPSSGLDRTSLNFFVAMTAYSFPLPPLIGPASPGRWACESG